MKVVHWMIAFCGLWEFGDIALPFVIGFDRVSAFVWNHILVGMILMFAGARAGLSSNVNTARTMDWMAATAGAWLILAPFLFAAPEIAAGRWNDILVGVIALILGMWAVLGLSRKAG